MISLLFLVSLFFYKKKNKTICKSCNKQLTAGAYPNWVCLRNECESYLIKQ
jgi:hypothetical protein